MGVQTETSAHERGNVARSSLETVDLKAFARSVARSQAKKFSGFWSENARAPKNRHLESENTSIAFKSAGAVAKSSGYNNPHIIVEVEFFSSLLGPAYRANTALAIAIPIWYCPVATSDQ